MPIMPQLTESMAMPMFVGAIDQETKYSSDPHFRITSVFSECVNNNAAAAVAAECDTALNCDNLNRNIPIKEEPVDSFAISAMAENAGIFLMHNNSNCDTTTTATATAMVTTPSSPLPTTAAAATAATINDGAVNRVNIGGNKRATSSATTYLCHRCRQVFGSRDLFEVHYKQSYNETPIYTCHICEKQMKNKRSYQRHFNRHSNAQKFACTICSKKFTQEKLLKKHETIHNLTTPKSCPECKEDFFDLLKFKAHRRTHHAPIKKQQLYQCSDCGKIMKNRSSLSMHAKIHTNDRQYGCMMCEQKFVQKINLINHLKVHNSAKTHSCSECGKSFVGQSQLLRHCTQHTNVRSFECEICKKFYKTRRDLKLHLMVHSSQRPHKCSVCSKTFLSTSKLKQHMNVHSGMRPYRCTYCPKDFTNFSNWIKHTRRRHKVDHKTGEKLVVMPNYLTKPNKTNKTGKVKMTKKAAKALASAGVASASDGISRSNNNSDDGRGTANAIKVEATEVMATTSTQRDGSDDQKNNAAELVDKCTMPFVVTKSGSDLSTITVNNRTLPLNTSDDLERAASLLMHQTLDFEDDMEFVNIKSELIDPMDAAETDGQNFGKLQQQSQPVQLHSNGLPPLDFPNFHGSDFLYYSYYPQATQCDFAMMPLPPINTVKRKLKGINSSSTIFPGMTNVL